MDDCVIRPYVAQNCLGGAQYTDFIAVLHMKCAAGLTTNFPHRWIGRGGLISRPAHSSHWTHLPIHFHLWGCCKGKVYETEVWDLDNPINRIEVAAADIGICLGS
jgi:hypothetical protein